VGKLDVRDKIIQKLVLIEISRKVFVHSFPLAAIEKCYVRILKDIRELIVQSKTETKRNNLYKTLFEVIENYNNKVLATKVYWNNPKEREEYKKFYSKYKKIQEKKKEKEILILKEEVKKLKQYGKKYQAILKLHKEQLDKRGAIRTIGKNLKTYTKLTYNKKG